MLTLHFQNLGNHIAGSLDDHCVAPSYAEAFNFVGIV
jgi:hypothetical protein